MRGNLPAFGLVLLLLAGSGGPASGALETSDHGAQELVPPTNGTFLLSAHGQRLAGTDLDPDPDRILAVTHHSWAAEVTDCHRRLHVDLTFRPESLTGDPDAAVDLPYIFDIAVTFNGTTWTHRVHDSPEQRRIGTLPDDGNLTIHLILRQGANVAWTFSAEARAALNCDGGIIIGRA